MAFALCMREIVGLVIVNRKAKLALVLAKVIPHEVGVLGLHVNIVVAEKRDDLREIDRLKSKLS